METNKQKFIWKLDENGVYAAFSSRGNRITWAPQDGSQSYFLQCNDPEVLYEGTRGPGKTDALLMDFARDVGKGWGADWQGIIFRRTYPELQDIITKSKKWFPLLYPGAKYNESKSFWQFPDGERLSFRQFNKESDYWKYHGHAYPWIGWEELTTWPDANGFKKMFSCNRSTRAGIPKRIRATTNPYGIGHNWVKARYQLPIAPGKAVGPLISDSRDEAGNLEPKRRAIHGVLDENKILLSVDPEYKSKLIAAARNKAELAAWLHGSWDIVAGGMFDDIWYEHKNRIVVEPFEVPSSWRIERAFDWGSSHPFSVGWYAVSDGTDLTFRNGDTVSTVRGDKFRIAEWYGWTGTPNEGLKLTAKQIAQGIVERELKWGLHGRVQPGPADSSIFDEENGNCIANDMKEVVTINGRQYPGVKWKKADKSPGSRKQGWEQIRKMMLATARPEKGMRESPGLFVVGKSNPQFLRTIPSLPRDDKDLDDVDTDAEDHLGDELRYECRFELKQASQATTTGHY